MWLPRVDFRTGRGVQEDLWGDTAISPARAGTNILEYGRLSELSKDLQYLRNVPFRVRDVVDIGDGGMVAYYTTKGRINNSRNDTATSEYYNRPFDWR